MNCIYGTDTKYFRLNNTAGSLLMNGRLHKVSPHCCIKTKEEPLKNMAGNREKTNNRGAEV